MGERTSIPGEPMAPELPGTASALRDGDIDTNHVQAIRTFFRNLPPAVDAGTREQAETQLSTLARRLAPHELRMVADRLAAYIIEEGEFSDPKERVRRRGAHLSPQGRDGMSKLTVILDPEGRAIVELIWDVLAKPGSNVADYAQTTTDQTDTEPKGAQPTTSGPTTSGPTTSGPTTSGPNAAEPQNDEATDDAEPDLRTQPQRRHDALMTCWRRILARRDLGATHRGIPISLVLTTTLAALAQRAGLVSTSTGSYMSIEDLIRMASNDSHRSEISRLLCVFGNGGRPLHLGREKRLASADQRLALFAMEKGCTFPGCSEPATRSQIHHVTDWARGGRTDIDQLTHACERHHPLVHDGRLGWATSTAPLDHQYAGHTLWHPPAVVDPTRVGVVNHFFHPENYLVGDDPP
ncbi:MAG: DUF222 domain-containing protein [Rhodococcus sp. (in: high G+C Gram-positive bacteria)]